MSVVCLLADAATTAGQSDDGLERLADLVSKGLPHILQVVWFLLFLFLSVILGAILRKVFLVLARKHASKPEDTLMRIKDVVLNTTFSSLAKVSVFIVTILGVIAFRRFILTDIDPQIGSLISRTLAVFIIIGITALLWHLVKLPIKIVQNYTAKNNRAVETLIPLFEGVLKAVILFGSLLMLIRVATNTQPTEIIAMLGVGGLALGLAAQDTVKNFFGSIMLLIDKPFQVGDVIALEGDAYGNIEKIGLRSTRVRRMDGIRISMPNGDLANKNISTISARTAIRRVMNMGLVYSTSPEQFKQAKQIVADILKDPRCIQTGPCAPIIFISDLKEFSINLCVIYHYYKNDLVQALLFDDYVNLEVLRRFSENGINFAFPTQTIYQVKAS